VEQASDDQLDNKGHDKELNEREKAFKAKQEKRKREQKERDGGLLKISEDLKGKDLYELLEIDAGCSGEELKKAYRKLVLVHHPDKMADPTEEQKKHFLLIQEAFDIVNDPIKKRRYESTIKFDDDIPSDLRKGYADDFFEKFGPVFKRNARWSERRPVPELGDENTPTETVKAFYEFWRNFESWRDPLAIAEQEEVDLHNLEEAESREEKRWMERENGKVFKKIKAGERERISDLTKWGEKHDPRMIAYRAQVAADKDAWKVQKAAAEEAERARKEKEAQEAAEAAEAARLVEKEQNQVQKKAKEETKNALKSARQRVRNLHKNAEPIVRHAVHADQLQEVCLALGTEDLCALASQLEEALAKDSEDCCEVVDLLHLKIKQIGATPIEDDSVQLNVESASTATPDSCNEEELAHELEGSPMEKTAKESTPEDIEAERLLVEAQEAEETLKREKKAEEQRKKREQKKREDEKRDAALRKAEAAQRAKERKAQEKAAAKESEKVEEKPLAVAAKAAAIVSDIAKNMILVVIEDGTVFASSESSDEVSSISEGSFLVASGPPVDVDGYPMVPLQPCGAVELRIVKRAFASLPSPAEEVTLEVDSEAEAAETQEEVVKKPSKTGKPQAEEEDLDTLLSEFGVVLQPVTKGAKKKGKK
jgi:curved DNA-binding protein CbpA